VEESASKPDYVELHKNDDVDKPCQLANLLSKTLDAGRATDIVKDMISLLVGDDKALVAAHKRQSYFIVPQMCQSMEKFRMDQEFLEQATSFLYLITAFSEVGDWLPVNEAMVSNGGWVLLTKFVEQFPSNKWLRVTVSSTIGNSLACLGSTPLGNDMITNIFVQKLDGDSFVASLMKNNWESFEDQYFGMKNFCALLGHQSSPSYPERKQLIINAGVRELVQSAYDNYKESPATNGLEIHYHFTKKAKDLLDRLA
jgi:hypothetical protein